MRKLGFITILLTLFISACTSTVDFKISFDSNGGSLVTPITTDGVASITTPKDPVKEGYTFAGWYWDNVTFRELFTVNSLLDRGITNDLTVYAKWSVDETYVPIGSVKVTFDSKGGTSVAPTYVLPGRTILIPSTTREGYTLDGWYTSVNGGVTLDERWSFTNNSVNNDITLYAKWNINTYTISFDTDGGNNIGSITQNYNTSVTSPSDPIKEGHTFIGWDQEIPPTMPADNVKIKALWDINTYTITFDTDGGNEITSITQDFNTSITIPENPTKVGYTFVGWSQAVPSLMPASNLTLTAQWTINLYTITFDTDGGNSIASMTQNYESSITPPTQPTRTGYTFTGWDQEIPSKMPAENITLKALWNINTYTITFDTDGGNAITSITQDFNTNITIPDNPTKVGYTFVGWSQAVPNTMPASNLTLTAKWEIINYSITYNLDNGINNLNNTNTFNVNTSRELLDPLKTGHTFKGWFKDSSYSVSYESIELGTTEDLTLYAQWQINQYTITFDSNGGTIVSAITQDYNTQITSPLNPRKLGYTFVGWSQTVPNTMPAENMFVIAQWELETYKITYVLNDGINDTRNQSEFTIISESFVFASPIKEGFTFLGWYTEDSFITEVIEISNGYIGDITLYAKWSINSYSVNYYIQPNHYDSLKDILLADRETIIQVSFGATHSSALTSSGRLFTWGSNSNGQLGDGTTTNRSTLTEITSRFGLLEGDTIIQVSLGATHSAALTYSGRLFTWGSNSNGQLGDGTTTNRSTPTEIISGFSLLADDMIIQVSLGVIHSAALTSSGILFTWGDNQNRQLGDGTTTNRYTPTRITSRFGLLEGDTIIQVSLGYLHNAALTSSGRLFTWGSNNFYGQLGHRTIINTTRPTPTDITSAFNLLEGDTIIQVSLGNDHSAALTSSGRLFAWGRNTEGQLGDGTTTNKNIPTNITSRFSLAQGDTIIQVSLGATHSSALTSSGRLFTWGDNINGQLGDGTTTNKSTPTEITSGFSLLADDMIIQVSLGATHSSALTSSGRLFTWGYNKTGQLGDGTTTQRNTPTEISQAKYEVLHFDTIVYNQNITEYIPLREGYTFDGWYSDIYLTTTLTFTIMPAEDIILYGCWLPNS